MSQSSIPTIWDQPLPRREKRAATTERFLTIWSRPVARLPEAMPKAKKRGWLEGFRPRRRILPYV